MSEQALNQVKDKICELGVSREFSDESNSENIPQMEFLGDFCTLDPWFPMVKLLVCTIARVLRVLVFKATSGAGQRGGKLGH